MATPVIFHAHSGCSMNFEALVEQSPDAMIFVDCNEVIQYWNRAAETLFGFSRQQVLHSALEIIIPEKFRAAHHKGFREALASGQTRYFGKLMLTKALNAQGDFVYVELAFSLIREQGAIVGVLATARAAQKPK